VKTPIEETIAQLERWIDSIDREKDQHMRTMADARASEIAWGFASARLAFLDVKRKEAVELLEDQKGKRHRWELLLAEWPGHRQLKVPLRRRAAPARKRA